MIASRVSVVVPCRNEAGAIDTFMEGVLGQSGVACELEVLVAEGGSTDGTRERLLAWQGRDSRVHLVDNPEGTVAPGLNRAIRAASGDIIVRMDVHTQYAPDYVASCVAVLQRTGAQNVGGPWRASGRAGLQEAVAIAFNSPFAVGGARGHRAEYEGPVDTVYLGCWKRDTLLEIGLFDPAFVRNQDDELNLRLARSGGLIWQSPSIKSVYFPRSRLGDLLKQYKQYGYWKVRVIRKHRIPASVRHLAPGAFVAAIALGAGLSPFLPAATVAVLALLTAYEACTLAAGVLACRASRRWRYLPYMPVIFACIHFGYGFGFLRGLWDFTIRRSAGTDSYRRLSRT